MSLSFSFLSGQGVSKRPCHRVGIGDAIRRQGKELMGVGEEA